MKKYVIRILIIVVAITVIMLNRNTVVNHVLPWLNPFNLIEEWGNLWAKEYTLDLKFHKSYEVDVEGIKEYERVKRKYGAIDENVPFTYFLQLPLDEPIIKAALKDLSLSFPDEILESSIKNKYVLLSFGRPLKDIKYKTTSYYNHIKAAITFCEEYKDDIVYVYYMEEEVFFWTADYYVMEGSQKKFLGHDLYYTYN